MKRPYLGGAGKDYDLHPDTCKRCLTGIDDDNDGTCAYCVNFTDAEIALLRDSGIIPGDEADGENKEKL